MEAGYYKPDLEEFCIGFEYELLEPVGNRWVKGQVYSLTDSILEDLYAYKFMDKDNIRVKLIDRADIEAEGWDYIDGNKFFGRFKKLATSPDVVNRPKRLLNFVYEKQSMEIEKRDEKDGDHLKIFIGHIRNRTELKKLLKQLGI